MVAQAITLFQCKRCSAAKVDAPGAIPFKDIKNVRITEVDYRHELVSSTLLKAKGRIKIHRQLKGLILGPDHVLIMSALVGLDMHDWDFIRTRY